MSALKLTRRKFLWTGGIVGAGLVVGVSLTGGSATWPIRRESGSVVPSAFLQITPDNQVIFYCPRDEMGQGVTTGLATLIGEELDVTPASMVVEFGGVHSDYANPAFGVQATGGSTSIRGHYEQLRQVGADVRAMLLKAAAQQLNVDVLSLSTDDGHIVSNGKKLPYGQFVETARQLEVPSGTELKPKSQWKFIGKEMPRIDGIAKATGTAQFGLDIDIPNLHRVLVKRSPVAGGKLKSFDASKARSVKGVTDVLQISNGVAIVATGYWAAKKALAVLETDWDLPSLSNVSTAQEKVMFAAAMKQEAGNLTGEAGDLDAGFQSASKTIDSEYWTPYLAHAPMEPMNAVVRIENGYVDVWSGTQGPAGAQGLVARRLDVDKETVRVHTPYLGGAFGRRGTLGHIEEAVEVAAATQKPVQVIWTREDDIQSGVYRPSSLMSVKAGADAQGHVTAWQAKRVGGNITPDVLSVALPAFLPSAVPNAAIEWVTGVADTALTDWTVDKSSIEGLNGDYDFPNQHIEHVTKDSGLPLTYWRSVGHSHTAFAKESAIDELAHATGTTPLELRLKNLKHNPRLRKVVEIAGERMASMNVDEGHALGLAAHGSFLSYVAEVADVSLEGGKIRVNHVLCVIDCGQAVNPDVVRAQMEGSIMYGLTAALHGNIELQGGRVSVSNFHDYPILRMNEAPSVEVIIVDSEESPTGVGEPGLPPIAPAVANAVFNLTGKRLRSLPLKFA